jgi:hypothetical protein
MKPGAALLGVVREDGKLDWAPPGVVVDEEFVRVASEGRDPLRRFRFTNSCVEKGCAQWKGTHCGVVDAVLENTEGGAQAPETLPECSIRKDCRWFSDRGAKACDVCPEVVTNRYVETGA